jgi:hypothetical protein
MFGIELAARVPGSVLGMDFESDVGLAFQPQLQVSHNNLYHGSE